MNYDERQKQMQELGNTSEALLNVAYRASCLCSGEVTSNLTNTLESSSAPLILPGETK